MTVIAGLVQDGVVYMGGDSAGVSGLDITPRADHKVYLNGEYGIGFTSSFRMGQILRYAFAPPAPPTDCDDLFGFMVTDFVGSVRQCFKKEGYSYADNGREAGGTFLVGVRGRLFSIQNDYQVGESLDGFDAVGCGDSYAIASLYTTAGLITDPMVRIYHALYTADKFSGGVCAPFNTIIVSDANVPSLQQTT